MNKQELKAYVVRLADDDNTETLIHCHHVGVSNGMIMFILEGSVAVAMYNTMATVSVVLLDTESELNTLL